ncbi:ABC transporter substrate-binding protein [Alloalcanivorax mobilis]|uniref:ABC transporter substrate-binding protein n=1 Tax=Alloalcanivorax mobilis TaxID=2019569 RepID=UPI000C7868D9|nr:ABC transporter substrate-binding protein [Alloalcanivorax mobilis]
MSDHRHDDDQLHTCESCDTGLSRRDFMRDIIAATGAGMFAAGSLGLPGQAFAAPDDEVLRIGYLPIVDAAVLLVAHAKGFFEEEGVKAEKPTLIRGWSPLVEGFASGKFNMVHFLKPIPIWMRYSSHFPVKIMSWAHVNGSAIVVGRHTGAQEFADLGGSQIAVPYWYSMHNVVLQMGLRQAGLTPVIKGQGEPLGEKEVNLQIMPPPDMPPALAARKIDAFIVAEPFNAAGEMLAGGKVLRFTGDMWKNHPCCVVCMNENQVNANPVWTQKVMNALVRAQNYAQANKKEVAHLLSRDGKGYLPMKAGVVERAMTFYSDQDYASPDAIRHPQWGNGRVDFQAWPYPSATHFIVEQMKQTLVSGDTAFLADLDPAFVAKDLVDDRFIRKSLEVFPAWKKDAGVDPDAPYVRKEVISV